MEFEGVEVPIIVILTLVLVDIARNRIEIPVDGTSSGLLVGIYYTICMFSVELLMTLELVDPPRS